MATTRRASASTRWAAPFTAALGRVLNDPELRERLAEAGRDAAATYPAGRYLDRLLAAYSFAAESARDPRPR